MRPEAVTPPPQKEWCPANMAAVFGLFMGSVAICNVSSLQVLRWFFASSLLELHVVLWGCGVVVCVCVFVLLAAWVPKSFKNLLRLPTSTKTEQKWDPNRPQMRPIWARGGEGAIENQQKYEKV